MAKVRFAASWNGGCGSAGRVLTPLLHATNAAWRRVFLLGLSGLPIVLAEARGQAYTLTVFAGAPGKAGTADGAGEDARFQDLQELAIDNVGTLYVADRWHHTIRRITREARVTTLAGQPGASGFVDASGGAARFNGPAGIALDGVRGIFVADAGNGALRQISPDGVVRTVTWANGGRAIFRSPQGVAVTATGEIFVTDGGGEWDYPPGRGGVHVVFQNTLQKLDRAGNLTTVAGAPTSAQIRDGVGAEALFSSPCGIMIDHTGNLIVTDGANLRLAQEPPTFWRQLNTGMAVRKITPGAVVTTLAGGVTSGFADGAGATARFAWLRGIAVDREGGVLVADRLNNAIRRITPSGIVSTVTLYLGRAGTLDASGAGMLFEWPTGLAFDAAGNLFVSTPTAIFKGVPTLVSTPPIIKAQSHVSSGPVTAPAMTFAVAAVGQPAPEFEWRKNGTPIPGATEASFTLPALGVADAGSYAVTLRNVAGTATSTPVVLGPPNAAAIMTRADTLPNAIRPVDLTVFAGQAAYFDGSSDEAQPTPSYQWLRNGEIIPDATSSFLAPRTQPEAAGSYSVIARNLFGSATSGSRSLSIIEQPAWNGAPSLTAFAGASAAVCVTIHGTRPALQWSRNGVPIPGATGSTHAFTPVRLSDAATYSIEANAVSGRVFSSSGGRLDVVSQPEPTGSGPIVLAGSATTLTVTTAGSGTFLQWRKNGSDLPGATGATYSLAAAGLADAGDYSIVAGDRRVSSGIVRLVVAPTSRLTNLSVRGSVRSADAFIVGFVMQGNAPERALLRGIGPGLAPFLPVSSLAGDPRLELFGAAGGASAVNDNWGGGTVLRSAFAQAGAFPLASDSTDAAMVTAVAGAQTAHLTARSDGTALVELFDLGDKSYDPNLAHRPPRLANISARQHVPAGGNLHAGFVIGGIGQTTVLIRAVGPTLAASFGVAGALSDPALEIFDGALRKLAGNDDWPPGLAPVFAGCGAFPLVSGSKDAALVLTLEAGAYTAVLGGGVGSSGAALIEIYELR